MARVIVPKRLAPLCRDREILEIEASDVRALFRSITAAYPELGAALQAGRGVAVAIDGEIVNDPLLEPLEPDSEVHFLARVSGGY